jgi:hypothetical protein
MYYNFARIHKTLRITPATAAGLSGHVWSLEEIVQMADGYMPKPGNAALARIERRKAVADEQQVIKLLEEIRDLQKAHVASYKEAVKNQQEAIDLQKRAMWRQVVAILVIVVVSSGFSAIRSFVTGSLEISN